MTPELYAALMGAPPTREELVEVCTFLNVVGRYGYTLSSLLDETYEDIELMFNSVRRYAEERKEREEAEAERIRMEQERRF